MDGGGEGEAARSGIAPPAHESAQPPGPEILAQEKHQVTVLFADLSGIPRAASELDHDDVAEVLYECMGVLMEEVRARDGWMEKNVGSGGFGNRGSSGTVVSNAVGGIPLGP